MTEGTFTVVWAEPARTALARLPEKVAVAVVEFVYGSMAQSPRRVGRPLRFELEGLYSREGATSVLYRIDDPGHAVEVVAVEHRSDVYRLRST